MMVLASQNVVLVVVLCAAMIAMRLSFSFSKRLE